MHEDRPRDLLINDASYPRGRISHTLFDFDGTISLIRYGWEEVMQELMEEMIAGSREKAPRELREEIALYIDESTGILTIYQMQWLEEAVRRWGMNPEVLSAKEYKRIYNERLLEKKVDQRVGSIRDGASLQRFLLAGAREFLSKLREQDVRLYLASGTDHVYVEREARLLGMDRIFGERIYGALDDTEEYTKENIIRRLLETELTAGEGAVMLVAGDGPVEIRAARDHGAVALGVASDEEKGQGWNPRKAERLENAGAHILIPDFREADAVLALIQNAGTPSRGAAR